jgi:ATP-binding cassette subfamily E protein 1
MPPKNKKKSQDEDAEDTKERIAIVSTQKCKPKKCRQECKRQCPVVRMGKLCIEVDPTSKVAFLSEELCIGCGICVKKCPFEAISIINLPKNLEKSTTHRYGANSFKLHRLPSPRAGQVLGLVGTNGIGKSTALKILGGKLKPNLGKYESPPEWSDILLHFRGSELQNYFTRILEDNLKCTIKPQYVDHIPKAVKGTVQDIITAKADKGNMDGIMEVLELNHVRDRQVGLLSGGELQRFAIATCCVQVSDVYMYDEPSSYLDVKQRLTAAQVIRDTVAGESGSTSYCIVVEHDLAVLDYLSDYICCLYGTQGAYGVVTMPFGVREGINIFLAGFVPTENLRFREDSLTFKVSQNADLGPAAGGERMATFNYPAMTKTMNSPGTTPFILNVTAGDFTDSEIIVLLGENGTGKTTFIRMLAGLLKCDEQVAAEEAGKDGSDFGVPELNVSYKPQKIAPKFQGSVRQLLHKRIRDAYVHPQFISDVMRPMKIDPVIDQEVQHLSGGELQRVAMALALGKPSDVYLIDEPSAYLDSEQRITCAKVIKRFIMHAKKTAFIVEHDFIMATYLADRVVVYTGTPGVEATATAPQSLLTGMNQFLEQLRVTFRRDPSNYRPRINKKNSVKDREQKSNGNFFFMDADDDDDI